MKKKINGGGIIVEVRAIIVAGGHGSRLYPLTKYTHKTLLPLQGRPIIDYVLATIRNAGISKITILSSLGCL